MTQYYEQHERTSFAKQKDILDRIQITNPVVFDVGANIGQSILQYKKDFPLSTIYSFEANEVVLEQLRKVAGDFSHVQCFNVALSDFIGETQFYATALPEVGSLLPPEHRLMTLSKNNNYEFHEVTVPVTTLDYFCEQNIINVIDILKIDVQGGEMKVLQGAKKVLESSTVKLIYAEVIMAPSYVGQMKLRELLAFLEGCGYQFWDILPFLHTRTGRVWAANTIFIHNDIVKQLEA